MLQHDDITATVDTAARELGGVNILVNNAGVGHGGQPTQTVQFETWQRVIDINLTAVFLFCSGYSLRSAAGNAPYSASKAGVWN